MFSWNLTPVHVSASVRGTARALSFFLATRIEDHATLMDAMHDVSSCGRGSRVDRFFTVPCNLLSCRLDSYLLACRSVSQPEK